MIKTLMRPRLKLKNITYENIECEDHILKTIL
jgi:hypothetical protein